MSEEELETSEAAVPNAVWWGYRALVCFWIVMTAGGLVLRWSGYRYQYLRGYTYQAWIEWLLPSVFLAACVWGLTRTDGAIHAARVTGVWLLALLWSGTPDLGRLVMERWKYGDPLDITGMSFLTSSSGSVTLMLLGRLLRLILLMALVLMAHGIYERRYLRQAASGDAERGRSRGHDRLLTAGLAGIAVGLGLLWLGRHVITTMHVDVLGAYVLMGGAMGLLLWHFMGRAFSLAAAIIGASVVILVYRSYSPVGLGAIAWVPLVGLGLWNVRRLCVGVRLRVAGVVVPVVFGAVTFSQWPVIRVAPLYFRLYPGPMAERPAEFPEYMRVPDGAYDVEYYGGREWAMSFSVEGSYPAAETLGFIGRLLEEAGWQRLDYDLLGPKVESSHVAGWHEMRGIDDNQDNEDYEGGRMRFWRAQWINDANDVVWVGLYGPGADDGNEVTLRGDVHLQRASSVRGLLENYRRVRTEEER